MRSTVCVGSSLLFITASLLSGCAPGEQEPADSSWTGVDTASMSLPPNLPATSARDPRAEVIDVNAAGPVIAASAVDGQALEVHLGAKGPFLLPVETLLPVLNFFGSNPDGSRLLYTSLDVADSSASNNRRQVHNDLLDDEDREDLVPSGDLYLESLHDQALVQIDEADEYVVSATWSPTDSSILSYSYLSSEGSGLTLLNLETGERTTFNTRQVVPDWIFWQPDGNALSVFVTSGERIAVNEERHEVPRLERQYISLLKGADASPSSSPVGLPLLHERSRHDISLDGRQPFSLALEDRLSVVMDDTLGIHELALRTEGREIIRLEAHRVEGFHPRGVVFKVFSGPDAGLWMVEASGNLHQLAAVSEELDWKFPMPTKSGSVVFNVTQVGSGYTTACNVYSHTGKLSFAFDMQAVDSAQSILAAGKGTVAKFEKNVSCNSLDTSGCAIYNQSCTSGYGNWVSLQHRDGTWSHYAHMGAGTVSVTKTGVTAERGCYLGMEGGTGQTVGNKNGCGNHLHTHRTGTSSIYDQTIPWDFPSAKDHPLKCTSYNSGNEYKTCAL